MLTWKVWTGSFVSWDALVLGFPDHCVYQCFGWGEYKARYGWMAVRMVAIEEGRTVALAQVLVRQYPGKVALGWVPGGPLGSSQAFRNGFAMALKSVLRVRHLYCRINSLAEKSNDSLADAPGQGWCRPTSPLLSGKSMEVDVALPEKSWLASINSKHRYYVKKSSSAPLVWMHGDDAALRRDFAMLTRQLSLAKKADLAETTVEMLDALSTCLSGSVLVLIGYFENLPVTGCLTLVLGGKAYYASAATVGEGRKLSAAYSMVAKLREILNHDGVAFFDFGGINPESDGASGVDHFKKGFGSRQIDYIGEWDWASSFLLRWVANVLIQRRASAMS